MSSRRTLILLAALAVGVIAAFLLFTYVKGIEDKAYDNAKRVEVYYASGEIKRGTPGEDAVANQDIVKKEIPQEFKPATAINSTDEVSKKVALFDIAPGTVIVKNMFVDPATTQISFRQRLKNPNHVAISFQSDQVKAVSGFLVGGDEVNMFAIEDLKGGAQSNEQGGGQTQQNNAPAVFTKKARMLYQKVQILAVGQNAKLQPGESTNTKSTTDSSSQPANIFTANVPPEASLWIASTQESNGSIYLSLVAEDYKPYKVRPVPDVITDLPGEDQALLTPYGPEGNTEK